jgi:hypothetical protein
MMARNSVLMLSLSFLAVSHSSRRRVITLDLNVNVNVALTSKIVRHSSVIGEKA